MKRPGLFLHIPHSSVRIPHRYRYIYLEPDRLHLHALAAADLYTWQLYRYPATTLYFPVSRLLCDVERFRDPAAEAMTKLGMWICYTHKMDGGELSGAGCFSHRAGATANLLPVPGTAGLYRSRKFPFQRQHRTPGLLPKRSAGTIHHD
jgi:hypothetical protein